MQCKLGKCIKTCCNNVALIYTLSLMIIVYTYTYSLKCMAKKIDFYGCEQEDSQEDTRSSAVVVVNIVTN